MKITVDSKVLTQIADDISNECTMLGFVDEDSIDEVDFYKARIEAAADDLRTLAAAPANIKPKQEEGKHNV